MNTGQTTKHYKQVYEIHKWKRGSNNRRNEKILNYTKLSETKHIGNGIKEVKEGHNVNGQS